MKHLFLSLILLLGLISSVMAESFELKSPNGKVAVAINVDDKISFSVNSFGKSVVKECVIGMTLGDEECGVEEEEDNEQ